MTKRILASILTISGLSVIIAVLLATALLHNYSTEKLETEIATDAEIIAEAVEINGGRFLNETSFSSDIRVTWISSDGRVIFDSEENPKELDDHSDRKEVHDAVEKGEGTSDRYSHTIMKTTLNHAVKLSDGTVIRVSSVHNSFLAQIMSILKPLLLILAITAVISALAAMLVIRSIIKPINDIDLDRPVIEKSYKELAPLVDKLRVQNIRVAHQLEQLNSSREQLSLITENMSEGLMIIGRKSTVLSCNSAAIRLLGNPNFKEGQSVYALNNSETFRRCIMNALGGVRSECILKADGGEREVIASPAAGTGALCGIVVFVMDVTERQQLETMRREFTSNVSHELKTPLTTIYGISDMLAGGMVDPADVPRFGADIKTEADRMITLISDIISLSKLDESDSSPHEEENIDIYELAQETLDRLKVGAAQKNVTCTLTGEHVHINGSRTVLGEVIYNLCDNAVKYNKEGGSVMVKVSHIPKIAMITVSDTGIGIPPEHLGRIFERFYRVDKSRSRKIKGTGLGLSIVKHGVLYHGGTVRADSTQGEGTTFTVELPITPQNVNA